MATGSPRADAQPAWEAVPLRGHGFEEIVAGSIEDLESVCRAHLLAARAVAEMYGDKWSAGAAVRLRTTLVREGACLVRAEVEREGGRRPRPSPVFVASYEVAGPGIAISPALLPVRRALFLAFDAGDEMLRACAGSFAYRTLLGSPAETVAEGGEAALRIAREFRQPPTARRAHRRRKKGG